MSVTLEDVVVGFLPANVINSLTFSKKVFRTVHIHHYTPPTLLYFSFKGDGTVLS